MAAYIVLLWILYRMEAPAWLHLLAGMGLACKMLISAAKTIQHMPD